MCVEERIKQVLRKHYFSKALEITLKQVEKEVLQILADFKIIPMEKWRELQKLLQTIPETHGPYAGNAVDKWHEKIEGKLKELQK